MKTIGLIGGMSWESTLHYYKIINEVYRNQLGGFHSAKILLYSVDFSQVQGWMEEGDWASIARLLSVTAENLEKGGVDFLVLCTNTMHQLVPEIMNNIKIPLLHIAEATAEQLLKEKLNQVALLGTRYTMEQSFYRDRLKEKGVNAIIPDLEERAQINGIIFDELCQGIVLEKSKSIFLEIILKLKDRGAQGVILGCTELGLLIQKEDVSLPVFDTTEIHATKAALLSMGHSNKESTQIL